MLCIESSLSKFIADIAGFTSWSSSRQPEDVFRLLETYFAAFDALAAKFDVFKVETIGKCSKMFLSFSSYLFISDCFSHLHHT